MNEIELCEYGPFELLLYPREVETTSGWKHLDFAVHKSLEGQSTWNISHLPSGCSIARGFPAADTACTAMIEIARMRNDWAVIWKDDLTKGLFDQVQAVAEKHGGKVGQDSGPGKWEKRLNEYASMQS